MEESDHFPIFLLSCSPAFLLSRFFVTLTQHPLFERHGHAVIIVRGCNGIRGVTCFFPTVDHGNAEPRPAQHASVVGRVTDGHHLLLRHAVGFGDAAQGVALVDRWMDDLNQVGVADRQGRPSRKPPHDHRSHIGQTIRRAQQHQLGHGDVQESVERPDEIRHESARGLERKIAQFVVEVIGIPLVEYFDADHDVGIESPRGLDDPADKLRIHGLVVDVTATRRVVDQCTVVVDLKRVEPEVAVDLTC